MGWVVVVNVEDSLDAVRVVEDAGERLCHENASSGLQLIWLHPACYSTSPSSAQTSRQRLSSRAIYTTHELHIPEDGSAVRRATFRRDTLRGEQLEFPRASATPHRRIADNDLGHSRQLEEARIRVFWECVQGCFSGGKL